MVFIHFTALNGEITILSCFTSACILTLILFGRKPKPVAQYGLKLTVRTANIERQIEIFILIVIIER